MNGIIAHVREIVPFVHNITNYVTVNDCANILLACGASPIMADDLAEVEEITSLCGALVINLGTLNERTIASMLKAGKKANELKHPVILDPVGVGASTLRTDTARKLMEEIDFSVIRGNASEIKTIYHGTGITKGVDVNEADQITENNLSQAIKMARELAEHTKAVIVITGKLDIVADQERAYVIRNGHSMMSKITGTGCMLTSVLGAFCAANQDKLLEAVAAGVCTMGICGELAYEKVIKNNEGTAAFRLHLIDAMSNMNSDIFQKRANYEVI